MEKEMNEMQERATSSEINAEPTTEKEYYVNIDGEEVRVDVEDDSAYGCLLNCLEGYYMYGGDEEEEECDDEEDEDDIDDEMSSKIATKVYNAGYSFAKGVYEEWYDDCHDDFEEEELSTIFDENNHPFEHALDEHTCEQANQTNIDYFGAEFVEEVCGNLMDEEYEYLENNEDCDFFDNYIDGITQFIQDQYHPNMKK